MRENGLKTNNMEKELKVGQMAQNTKVIIEMVRKMVKAHSTSQTEASLQANSFQMRLRATAVTCGQMENPTWANGFKTKCTDRAI